MEPFVGEVRILPYVFAPLDWARCEGQLYPISQNQKLYAIVGTIYGGDGRATFALPNLRGRSPMHFGAAPGLTPRLLGRACGSPTVSLAEPQLPKHGHTAQATFDNTEINAAPNANAYPGPMLQSGTTPISGYKDPDANVTPMAMGALDAAGQSEDHENRQPYLGLYFCIALDGMYPPHS
jgi:microcystin-dependent protein